MSENPAGVGSLITIRRLPADRWQDFRKIRLEALETEPYAFLSSSTDEEKFPETTWRERIVNHIFALNGSEVIGMIGLIFRSREKQKHIADIFSFYVRREFRDRGIGNLLLIEAINFISSSGGISKIELSVVSDQKAAIKVYEKNGFRHAGILAREMFVNGHFHDEILMEKLL
ncbi:MAG: GNAT family N-acetyltransferase [Candidatus Thermoplasmatota archaeon]|nr:GNAT family N-acetyltransferase [Candidatus Thermoplasmatota archaeon]